MKNSTKRRTRDLKNLKIVFKCASIMKIPMVSED